MDLRDRLSQMVRRVLGPARNRRHPSEKKLDDIDESLSSEIRRTMAGRELWIGCALGAVYLFLEPIIGLGSVVWLAIAIAFLVAAFHEKFPPGLVRKSAYTIVTLFLVLSIAWRMYSGYKVDPLSEFKDVRIEGDFEFGKNVMNTVPLGDCPNDPCFRISLRNWRLDTTPPRVEFDIYGLAPEDRTDVFSVGVPLRKGCWVEMLLNLGFTGRILVEETDIGPSNGIRVWVGIKEDEIVGDPPVRILHAYRGCDITKIEEVRNQPVQLPDELIEAIDKAKRDAP